MERTRQRALSVERHADGLARWAVKNAGPTGKVAKRWNQAPSTVSHERRDRANPVLRQAFALAMALPGDGTSARACARALEGAVRLREIIAAETSTLIARGCVLMDREARANAEADLAAVTGAGFADAHRAQAAVSDELADIRDELAGRGTDLLVEYRRRA